MIRWGLLTVRRGVAITASQVALLVLLLTLAIATLSLSTSVTSAVTTEYVRTGSLGQVEVTAPMPGESTRALTTSALDEMAALPGVDSVDPNYATSLPWPDRGAVLAGATWQPLRKTLLVEGRSPSGAGQIVLPERVQAHSTAGLLGQDIVIDATVRIAEGAGKSVARRFRVVGIYSLKVTPERPDTAYIGFKDSLELAAARAGIPAGTFAATRGADAAVLQTGSTAAARTVAADLVQRGFGARATADRVADLAGAPGLVRVGAWALAGLTCLVFVTSAIARSLDVGRRRLREFALLRSLGWGRERLSALVLVENVLVTACAGIMGVVLGVIAAHALLPAALSLVGSPRAGLEVPWLVLGGLLLFLGMLGALASTVGARRALVRDPYLVARADL